jgi:two-component system, LytTR family, sensor kinase
VTVDDSVRNALVPTLLLQPLVENAFKHGVSMIEETGVVGVDARRVGADLVLTVTDNGPGPVTPNGSGEGVANTRKRLEELYGDQQRFELRQASRDGGAVVTVRLPYHTARLVEMEAQAAW